MRAALLTVVLVVLPLGCDGGSGGEVSCASGLSGADGGARQVALCVETSGATADEIANNRTQCAMQGNTFATAPCPRTGAVGGCRYRLAGTAVTTWYYAPDATAADVAKICDGLARFAQNELDVQFVMP